MLLKKNLSISMVISSQAVMTLSTIWVEQSWILCLCKYYPNIQSTPSADVCAVT